MFSLMKMRYTTLVAAALLALPLAWGADSPSADSLTMPGAAPLPTQPGTAAATPNLAATPADNSPAPASPTGSDPVPGDSAESALKALGRPNGQLEMADQVIYMFERGTVMVSSTGIVEEVNLTPLANFQKMKDQESQEQTEFQATHVRANALLEMLLSDPTYTALATRDRILALQKFDRDHPGSDASQDIKDLVSIYQAEMAVQTHLAELENKTKQAQNQTSTLQQRLTQDEKSLATLRDRTEIAEQQAAQAAAQQAAAQPQQILTNPFVVGGPVITQAGPVAKVGGGGVVVITPGGAVVEQPARPILVNGSVKSSPATGTWVMQPDGTVKIITPDAGTN
jgi:hypothetical protein